MFRLKAKSLASALCTVFVALGPVGARADAAPKVLFAEDSAGPPRTELLLALRIQLTGVAEIEGRSLALPSSTSARIDAASALASAENALAVVWTEGPVQTADGSQEAILYVVGQSHGRALLEVVRVPGNSGPDMDRTLALKVREIIDTLRRAQSSTPRADALVPNLSPAGANEPAARFTAAAALGVLGAAQSGTPLGQWGATLAAGPRLYGRALRLSGMLGLVLLPRSEVRKADARVGLVEITPSLYAHGQAKVGWLWLGARAGFALAFVTADGSNARGARGVASEELPSMLLGLDAELPLGSDLGLCLGVQLETRLRRQRFAVDERQIADLGRLRPSALLALTWRADGSN
jgi:hypothetical protein